MALSTVYRVVTKYESDTTRAESRLSRLSGKVDRLTRQSDRLRERFQGMFRFATRAAVGFATLGLGFAARRAVQLNQELENTKTSIASAFDLQGVGDFTSNLEMAERLMSRLSKAAITSPGTRMDLASIVRSSSPALAAAMATESEMAQFGARGVGAAFSQMGGDVQTSGMQLLQMMQGRGGSDLALFNILKKPLAKNLGVDGVQDLTKALNDIAKNDPRKFFLGLNASLASLDEANKSFATSFTGLWSSIQEVLDNVLLTGAKPLFDYLKREMQELLKWAEENHDEIQDFARTVGEKLKKGFELAAAGVKMVANNLEVVVGLLGAVMARRAGLALLSAIGPGGVARGAGSFLAANASSGMARGRQMVGGLKGGIKGGAGSLANFASEAMFGGILGGNTVGRGGALAKGLRSAPGKLKGAAVRQWMGKGVTFETLASGGRKLGGMAGGALSAAPGAALGALGTSLSALLGVLAPLLVVIGMVVGTFRVLKDTTNEATIFLMTSWNELLQMLDVVAMQFGQKGGFVQAVTDFVDWLGTGVVGVFGLVVKAVERIVAAFSFMLAVFKGVAIGIGTLMKAIQTGDVSTLLNAGSVIGDAVNKQLDSRQDKIREAMIAAQERAEEKKAAEEKRDKGKDTIKKTRPQVKFEINQDIRTDANPDQIAFRVEDVLKKRVFRNKRAIQLLADG